MICVPPGRNFGDFKGKKTCYFSHAKGSFSFIHSDAQNSPHFMHFNPTDTSSLNEIKVTTCARVCMSSSPQWSEKCSVSPRCVQRFRDLEESGCAGRGGALLGPVSAAMCAARARGGYCKFRLLCLRVSTRYCIRMQHD